VTGGSPRRLSRGVDRDLEAVFDHLDHGGRWERRRLRLDDRALRGWIRQGLKAGILETDAVVIQPETSTPPGGGVSPVLANVYLPEVRDLGFERGVKPLQG
jgi:hypothetical protein